MAYQTKKTEGASLIFTSPYHVLLFIPITITIITESVSIASAYPKFPIYWNERYYGLDEAGVTIYVIMTCSSNNDEQFLLFEREEGGRMCGQLLYRREGEAS